MEIKIKCKYDDLVDPSTLNQYHKNRNEHPQDQIERLVVLFKTVGVRHPIIVDADDKKTIVVGNGRQLAGIRAGIKKFPVEYQKFNSEEERYAFCQSDNAISEWSELNLSKVNSDIADLGPDFDLDTLGIKGFTLDFNPQDLELKTFSESMGEKSDYFSYTLTINKEHKELFESYDKEKVIDLLIKSETKLYGN